MKSGLKQLSGALLLVVCFSAPGFAANEETINTVDAWIGENSVTVHIFCHNETGLLEYFNLIIFDDTRLEYAGIAADRGGLWYGNYPTHVAGNHIYVHGVAGAPTYCINPDTGDPGAALFHITFNIKPGADAGLASVYFASEGIWDGHWNNCGGYPVSPTPDYHNGGVNILGHAGHVTIGTDSAGAGQQAIVDVYMHNDLDIFEYFHQILFENAAADVDSIVASRGVLHYGFYPTHVSGDTIFVHGWAGSGSCFYDDPAWPGQVLYRIYFTMAAGLPPGYTMPLLFRTDDPTWNHWVGCDLTTTDSFEKTDGWVHVPVATGIDTGHPAPAAIRFGAIAPNPASRGAVASYYLSEQGRVEVDIYDAAGRKIRILQRGSRIRGWHDAGWDGADETGKPVPSGVYFYRLRSGSEMVSRKIVVIR